MKNSSECFSGHLESSSQNHAQKNFWPNVQELQFAQSPKNNGTKNFSKVRFSPKIVPLDRQNAILTILSKKFRQYPEQI